MPASRSPVLRARIALLSVALCLQAFAVADPAAPDYASFRATRVAKLTAPFGWFSLVALQWLKPGTITIGSAPENALRLDHGPAHLVTLASTGPQITVRHAAPGTQMGGAPVPDGAVLPEDEGDAGALRFGTIRLWAIERGGKRYVRIKDADAPARLNFHGLRWYAPDPSLRVTAQWVPYTSPRSMQVLNKLGQTSSIPVPGYAQFNLHGRTLRLTPDEVTPDRMEFVFRDETYKQDTDGGGRFLVTAAPSNGPGAPGTVVLDFNEAVNPPCAYTPFATCPLATPENRLPVAVPGGEKRYED